jgi:hypothetical protein
VSFNLKKKLALKPARMSDNKWDSSLVTINRSLGKNTQTKNNSVNENWTGWNLKYS